MGELGKVGGIPALEKKFFGQTWNKYIMLKNVSQKTCCC